MDANNFSGKKTAVALGMFDGVHIGHRAVFERAESFENDFTEAAVFTFDSGSISSKHGKSYRFIVPNSIKLRMIREAGIKNICCADFSELKDCEPEEFVRTVISGKMNAAAVVCGPDYRFGKNAAGSVDLLKELGRKYGFEVSTVSPVEKSGEKVSSSGIRKLLAEGNVKKAGTFLGYRYRITAPVTDGNHIGRTIGFPTINQSFEEGQLIPAYGVYASGAVIDGRVYSAVTNIGVKPTVEDSCAPLAETHIIGYSGNLYGQTVEVSLSEYLRGEQKFSSVDELKAQIKKDTEKAKALGEI